MSVVVVRSMESERASLLHKGKARGLGAVLTHSNDSCKQEQESEQSEARAGECLRAVKTRETPSARPEPRALTRTAAVARAQLHARAVAMTDPNFVRAVLVSFDPVADPALRSQANASLEQLRQSPDGWLFCLQAFSAAAEEHVKFWCLQTLVDMAVRDRRYAGLPQEQKATLRQALVSWLQAKGAAQTDEPASVKNKFSQLLVRGRRLSPRCGCCGGCWLAGWLLLPPLARPLTHTPLSRVRAAHTHTPGGDPPRRLPAFVARRLPDAPFNPTEWPRLDRPLPPHP